MVVVVVVLMEVGRTGALGLVEEVDVDVGCVDVVIMVGVEMEVEVEVEVEVSGDEDVVVWLVEVLADEDCETVMVTITVVGEPSTVEVRVLVCVTAVSVPVGLCTPRIKRPSAQILSPFAVLFWGILSGHLQPMLSHT